MKGYWHFHKKISPQHQCLAKHWRPCLDEYYHNGTWYTQTFLWQLLCGRNKNQFFHYFSLLHDLLHRQDLLKKCFWRKLKSLVMFLSIFGKGISPGWFCCPNFTVTLKWIWNFSVTNNFNFLCMSWVFCPAFSFSSFYWKFKTISIRNYNQQFTFQKASKEFRRNFISYIRKSFKLRL